MFDFNSIDPHDLNNWLNLNKEDISQKLKIDIRGFSFGLIQGYSYSYNIVCNYYLQNHKYHIQSKKCEMVVVSFAKIISLISYNEELYNDIFIQNVEKKTMWTEILNNFLNEQYNYDIVII